MLNRDEIVAYCLGKKGAVKEYPFDKTTAVFKVANKMFALMGDDDAPARINLKCDPLYALELRSIYESVIPGYHMNKKHWNTVILDGEADVKSVKEWIDDSYELVLKGLSKKTREQLRL